MVQIASYIVIATALVLGVKGQLDQFTSDMIMKQLTDAKVVPDVIDAFEPSLAMKVMYGDLQLEAGMTLAPADSRQAPQIFLSSPNPETQYTVAMVNLDGRAPAVNWIATNINGDELSSTTPMLSQDQQYLSYRAPYRSASATSPHRIAFLAFEQIRKNQEFQPATVPETNIDDIINQRFNFNVKEFAQVNDLKLVSASYMNAQPATAAPRMGEKVVKQANLVGDLVDNLDHALDDLLGKDHHHEDLPDEGRHHDDDENSDFIIVHRNDNHDKVRLERENTVKQAGLVGDLLDTLDGLLDDLGIDLGINDDDYFGFYQVNRKNLIQAAAINENGDNDEQAPLNNILGFLMNDVFAALGTKIKAEVGKEKCENERHSDFPEKTVDKSSAKAITNESVEMNKANKAEKNAVVDNTLKSLMADYQASAVGGGHLNRVHVSGIESAYSASVSAFASAVSHY